MTLFGANSGGMEDGNGNIAFTNYNVPDPKIPIACGFTIDRIPYTSSRWYTAPGYQGHLLTGVAAPLIAAGILVVLDEHTYGKTWDQASAATVGITTPQGAKDFIQHKLDLLAQINALKLDHKYICIGLNNEPQKDMNDVDMVATCFQPAITALRSAGFGGWIEVPKNDWQQAYTVTVANPYPAKVVDPLNQSVLGLHGYGDATNAGQGGMSSSSTTLQGRFKGANDWFLASGKAAGFAGLFASEFGTASSGVGLADTNSQQDYANLITLFQANPSVWWGATGWTVDTWLAKNGNFLGNAGNPTPNLKVLMAAAAATKPPALVVYLSADAYQGPAIADLLVDGKVIASQVAVSATRLGAPQAVTVPGTFAVGKHTLAVKFGNDLYAGSPTKDRNLFVVGATFGGAMLGDSYGAMMSDKTFSINFTVYSVVGK